jgi:hypothetical protein
VVRARRTGDTDQTGADGRYATRIRMRLSTWHALSRLGPQCP